MTETAYNCLVQFRADKGVKVAWIPEAELEKEVDIAVKMKIEK